MDKHKFLETLDKLEKLGFVEYWPPSHRRWHFKKNNVIIDADIYDLRFFVWFSNKQLVWSDKHQHYIYG